MKMQCTWKNIEIEKKPAKKEKAMLEDIITKDNHVGKKWSPRHKIVRETTTVNPVVEVRRSNKVIWPPHMFSPSVNYLLLNDNGEPLCYHETLQMSDST